MNVLVLGGSGLLGSALMQSFNKLKWNCYTAGRSEAHDLQLKGAFVQELTEFLSKKQISHVVNLVALTNVDACEEDPYKAYLINTEFVDQCISAVQNILPKTIKFIHISTDQVYSGIGPHLEGNAYPINVYGLTKLLADKSVLRAEGLVLRVNFFGKSLIDGRSSFSDWVIQALREKKQIPVFYDVYINALSIASLCEEIQCRLVDFKPGIYNLGTSDGFSKAELAFAIARKFGFDEGYLSEATVESVALKARRPNDMRMDVSHYQNSFNTNLPSLEQELDRIIDEYQ